MSGIVINIDPVIFHVGGFALSWHSLVAALAILAGILVAFREGRRRGFGKDDVYPLALWGIAGGFIGARLFHVVENLDYYGANPWSIFAFQRGGLAIWGGLIGGALAVAIYSRIRGLPLAQLADGAVPAVLVGQIIGRIGCIINGDAYGGLTGLPWGFVYSHPDALVPGHLRGVPTHPYPVYEMIWNLAILLSLWLFRTRLKTEGLLFFSYVSLYSIGRLLLSFVRQEKIWFWGLQEAQVIALLALPVSVLAITYLLTRRKRLAEQEVLPD